MFKTVVTLVRGGSAAVTELVEEQSALLILDQQIRDAAAACGRARRALALAIAQDRQEALRLEGIVARIVDLEARAKAALSAKREDLARDAAQAIADLEADRDAALAARTVFAGEVATLKEHVARAGLRLSELDRGRRLARASEAVRALRCGPAQLSRSFESSLSDAEATLRKLRERQLEGQFVADAIEAIEDNSAAITLVERLAAQGFGPPLRQTADDVLARLKLSPPEDA